MVFIGFFFFALPRAFVLLGERLAWPRWESDAGDAIGTLLIASGIGVGLYCSGLFRRLGRGTPVPIEPPTRLVVTGLYGFSRHPMYVCYVAIAIGILLVEGHAALLLYPVALFLLAEAYVVWWEEPVLLERFGPAYDDYRRRVPRWLGRRADA
jgi:protein-S-isoprenylcysteine O-methyltransferase Ste14